MFTAVFDVASLPQLLALYEFRVADWLCSARVSSRCLKRVVLQRAAKTPENMGMLSRRAMSLVAEPMTLMCHFAAVFVDASDGGQGWYLCERARCDRRLDVVFSLRVGRTFLICSTMFNRKARLLLTREWAAHTLMRRGGGTVMSRLARAVIPWLKIVALPLLLTWRGMLWSKMLSSGVSSTC